MWKAWSHWYCAADGAWRASRANVSPAARYTVQFNKERLGRASLEHPFPQQLSRAHHLVEHALVVGQFANEAQNKENIAVAGKTKRKTLVRGHAPPRRAKPVSGYALPPARRRRRALSTTDTDEAAMAAPASMGDMAGPPNNNSSPAAMGMSSTL